MPGAAGPTPTPQVADDRSPGARDGRGAAGRERVAPGVYVHVPFCAARCGYCDFNVLVGADARLRARYVEALLTALDDVASAGPRALAPPAPGAPPGRGTWPVFGSVFVGGGTPTELDPRALARVLARVRAALPVAPDAEVTVEANPEDVTEASLAPLVAAGLSRLSLGAQSTSAHVLAFLDRRHDPAAVPRAVAAARAAGVASVSVDLIYGAPAETAADWRASLEAVVALEVDHVSCYSLTLEPNTPYARAVAGGSKAAPDDDVAAERMAAAAALLGASGFERYEVSNWARPGHRSRHNRMYWAQGDYVGIGAGAHGHWAGRRWWNVRSTVRWTERVLAGRPALGGAEVLDAEQRRAERLLLGLRRVEGVAAEAVGPLDAATVAALRASGLLADDPRRLRLTARGMAMADAVTLRLLG